MHQVTVPLAHVPDHTWRGLSEQEWAVNLGMYATQPERFLSLQCEGECWCDPPDARAHSWAGHGRGPTACPFEARPFDEALPRAVVAARQAQAVGQALPPIDATLMLDVVAALAHQPGWCACPPAMLARLDELRGYLSRGWSFETFPVADPATAMLRAWVAEAELARPLLVSGGVGRGKTGLAAAAARRFVAVDPMRTAFLGRLGPVREELAGETGAALAAWLERVDQLILDDLDFGWGSVMDGDRGSTLLAESLKARIAASRATLLTAHVPHAPLVESVPPALRQVLDDSRWSAVVLAARPSLRTGRLW